ncbi:Transcription factor lepE-like protein [Cladobotryum mycophilum]|uniref:Transcription factor lepE-like protein n=1 Tax=Cladobotryum mycophilum TaxID=491253 RepID=A0ABR0SXS2_9HYPO
MDKLSRQQESPSAKTAEKKRRRPPLACEQCRKRKIRCDRNVPCGHCIRANIPSCTYAPVHIPAWRAKKVVDPLVAANWAATSPNSPTVDEKASSSAGTGIGMGMGRSIRPAGTELQHTSEADSAPVLPAATTSPPSRLSSNPASSSGASNVDWLVARVQELEEKLARVVLINDCQDGIANKGRVESQEMIAPTQGLVAKSRYFGQSHWMHGLDLFPLEFDIIARDEVEKGDLSSSLAKCKTLGRKIKKNRVKKPLSSTDMGTQIPSRQLADQLVENYLRTFEGVFRIVHVPTFRSDYERYWQNPAASNESFVILLQLYVVDAPPEKKRVNITGVQILCLLTLAKSTCSVGHDMSWIMAGTLVRKAMFLGLHRDPKHLGGMTIYRAEIHRRLWATVLELNMQFSFEAGGAPLISTAHYDTQPPANLNDDELSDDKDGDKPAGHPSDVPTQTSVQRALVSTIPLRINLINHINNNRPGDAYEETLRFNSSLTKACRAMTQLLTSLRNKPDSPVRSFHISVAEMFLYRCFHSLHQPVIVRYVDDARFFFSRKMCLDSALKLLHIWGLPDAWVPTTAAGSASDDDDDDVMDRDLKRLITNGTGIFRNIASQAMLIITIELLHRKTGEATSLGYLPTVGGSDLHARLVAAQAWNLARARAGETNTKGIIFIRACLAHVDALEAGLDSKEKVKSIFQAATEVSRQCWEILKEVAEREGLPASAWEDEVVVADMEYASTMAIDWMQVWDDMQGMMTWPQWDTETAAAAGAGFALGLDNDVGNDAAASAAIVTSMDPLGFGQFP